VRAIYITLWISHRNIIITNGAKSKPIRRGGKASLNILKNGSVKTLTNRKGLSHGDKALKARIT